MNHYNLTMFKLERCSATWQREQCEHCGTVQRQAPAVTISHSNRNETILQGNSVLRSTRDLILTEQVFILANLFNMHV